MFLCNFFFKKKKKRLEQKIKSLNVYVSLFSHKAQRIWICLGFGKFVEDA
jgi:hypothetical protein